MSRLLIVPVVAAFTALGIASCNTTPTRPAPRPQQDLFPTPKASPTPTPTPALTAPSTTPPPVQSSGDIKYAKPAPGKPGFVTLPGNPALIDVRGLSPGEQAKDPVTGQLFLVP